MCFRRFIMPVVIFVALSLTLVDTQAVFAAANSGDDKPIERAKWMVFDETRSTMFILNNDDTLSAYDAANNTFTLSRKSFPGVKNAYYILTRRQDLDSFRWDRQHSLSLYGEAKTRKDVN